MTVLRSFTIGRYLAAMLLVCSLVFIPSWTVFGNVFVNPSESAAAKLDTRASHPHAYQGYPWFLPEELHSIDPYAKANQPQKSPPILKRPYSRYKVALVVSAVVVFFAGIIVGSYGQRSAGVNAPVISRLPVSAVKSDVPSVPGFNSNNIGQGGDTFVVLSQPFTENQLSPENPQYKARPSLGKQNVTKQPLPPSKVSPPSQNGLSPSLESATAWTPNVFANAYQSKQATIPNLPNLDGSQGPPVQSVADVSVEVSRANVGIIPESHPTIRFFEAPSFLKILNNALATELDFSGSEEALGELEAIIKKVRHPDSALNAAKAQGYIRILETLKGSLTQGEKAVALRALQDCQAYYVDGFLNIPNPLLHYLELKAWTESYLKPKRVDEIGWSFDNQNPFYLVADRLIRDVAGQLLSDADAEVKINTLIEQFNDRFNQELMSENASGNPDSHMTVETVE